MIAFALIGGLIYTMLQSKNSTPFKEYLNSLDAEQRAYYLHVVKRREQIFFEGMILGLVIGFISLYLHHTKNKSMRICLFVIVALGINYLYYILAPKPKLMVTKLNNQKQIDLWTEVYKHMQYRYHMGMLLGAVGYCFLAYAITR